MRRFTELFQAKSPEEGGGRHLIRWRGKTEGPYGESEIEQKLKGREIGMSHEVFCKGRWITLRAFLEMRESARSAREAGRRKEREAAERAKAYPAGVEARRQPAAANPGGWKPLTAGVVSGAGVIVLVGLIFVLARQRHSGETLPAGGHGEAAAPAARGQMEATTDGSAAKEATKRTWREMQKAEFDAMRDNAGDPAKIFNAIAFGYTQIDSEGADPELQAYIGKRMEVAKEISSVFQQVEQELQSKAEERNDVAGFCEVVGEAIGAVKAARSEDDADNDMTIGGFAGGAFGTVAANALVSDDDVRQKYASQLESVSEANVQSTQERQALVKRLDEKYGILLLDAAN